MTVINSDFNNITASYSGGGGVVYSTDSVTVINCTIMNSIAISSNGGAIYSEGRINICNSLLVNNTVNAAYSRGGTLYSMRSITVTNCSIINSFADGYGGAIYGMNVNINDSILSNTISNSAGGAVYSATNVAMVNSSFNNCSANVGNSGAVYCTTFIKAINCTITDSSVSVSNGGALYSGNDVTVINCTIGECSAVNGKGGAIYSSSSQSHTIHVVLSKSSFNNNSATSGGVLYTDSRYHYNMEFSDSTFMFTEALGSITGGGVACNRNTTLSITNCTFNENTAATDGGVLDLNYSSMSIARSLKTQLVVTMHLVDLEGFSMDGSIQQTLL